MGNEDLKLERERRMANSSVWLTLATFRVLLFAFCTLGVVAIPVALSQPPAVWIDPDTGCEYLHTVAGGIFPRLNNRGRQMGCR